MRKIYSNILGWMAALVTLFVTSCTQDMTFDSDMSGDDFEVSFTIIPQDAMKETRAGGGEENSLYHIGDGKKANMLIYAVYDEDYNLLPQFGKGPEKKLQEMGITAVGQGQTALYVDEFPFKRVSIRLVRGRTYKVAFWAQNVDCKAYNTKDLKKVEVIYNAEKDSEGNDIPTPNNDESRDVFCQVATVSSEWNRHETITLYRPLAQINVGTSGYDFEIATRGENSKKYRYSKILISSAARYLSVPENKVLTSTTADDSSDESVLTTEVRTTLNYDFAPIPAYYNYPGMPDDPSTVLENEEFLRVDLNRDEAITGYIDFDTYKKNEGQGSSLTTETFKYLSMCYILVPVQESNADVTNVPGNGMSGGTNEYTTTLDNVTVWLAESKDSPEDEQLEILKLTNVPVHRNWRTNIVSQQLLTAGVDLKIDLQPMYSGDYNTGDLKTWSGPLAEGVFYDAVNDEILISNAYGLQWLGRMVNGRYSYKAYDIQGQEFTFEDEGIQDPTAVTSTQYKGMSESEKTALRARIMRATHQEWNSNTGGNSEEGGAAWPNNNNFHFMYSTNDNASNRLPSTVFPAKVRLMADIDLGVMPDGWIPIGFANNTAETYDIFTETEQKYVAFCGEFDGGNHTIYNLRNKRFGASVYGEEGYVQTSGTGPYDRAVQWFAVGLFGQIGQNGSVSNLRLNNVDLYGYCHVGGIAGILTGQDAFIYNCYVDGGTIVAAPMYRGDVQRVGGDPKTTKGRTFARGIFAGGIVGYLNIGRNGTARNAWNSETNKNDPNIDKYASVLNCDVRNITLRAYRQIGGIAGAINIQDKTTGTDANKKNDGASRKVRKIEGNKVNNVTIIADKFQPYDAFFNTNDSFKTGNPLGFYRNGFGWQVSQLAWSDTFVGGNPDRKEANEFFFYEDVISPNTKYDVNARNTSSNVIITEFATSVNDEEKDTQRMASIKQIPLNLMPMLSSFFSDDVSLYSNFTGNHSAYKKYGEHNFYSDSRRPTETKLEGLPFNLPNDLSIDWKAELGKVGMYIESITLHGNPEGRDRTIVTVEDVMGPNDCVAYVASRDRSQFQNIDKDWNKQKTVIDAVVFRGQPYAYTGICLAPNPSTEQIELKNVSVYDVFQALALETGSDASDTTLKVTDSNFRGYVNYGIGWKKVEFLKTVFERGAYAVENTEDKIQTCEIKTPTTFKNCYFKAPYTIKIAKGVEVTFDNSVATSAGNNSVKLDASEIDKTKGGTIKITTDLQGNPIVTYSVAE